MIEMENIMNNISSKNTKMNPDRSRLQTMMDAASALTVLGDDETTKDVCDRKQEKNASAENRSNDMKRYLPDHKKPDAAPTFPEKLMSMMLYAEQQGEGFCVRWLEDGKSFIIDDPDTFTKKVVPQFFKPTKFSSFTRKLYRWGFRQLNRGMGQDDPVIFGNDYFQRKKPELMAKMKSTTAAATRKEMVERVQTGSATALAGMKRPAEIGQIELQQQLLLSQLLNKKANYETTPTSFVPQSSLFPCNLMSMNQFRHLMQGSGGTNDVSLAKMMFPSSNPSLSNTSRLMNNYDSSLLTQYMPNAANPLGAASLYEAAPRPPNMPYYPPMAASTADIVNAAIQALKNT